MVHQGGDKSPTHQVSPSVTKCHIPEKCEPLLQQTDDKSERRLTVGQTTYICCCGGTGRRKGLKIPRQKYHTGSIPVSSTIPTCEFIYNISRYDIGMKPNILGVSHLVEQQTYQFFLIEFFNNDKVKNHLSQYGGIGRHDGFRFHCFMRVGSNPTTGTKV